LAGVAQKLTEDHGVLCVNGTGRRHGYRVPMKIGHYQVVQQKSAVGMRIGTHPPVALWGQIGQFRQQRPFSSNSSSAL
jgi:hypothetical protein